MFAVELEKLSSKLSDYLFISIPFGIYFGWISVATIANISSLLIVNNWNGFGMSSVLWTMILLTIGTILGILMIILRKEVAYPLVIIWSFVGILVARTDQSSIQITAGLGAGIVLIVLLLSFFTRASKKAGK